MSADIDALKGGAGASQTAGRADAARPPAERDRLASLAAEFESSLMVQMLRQMRRPVWSDEQEQEGGGLGSHQSLFEMLDAELAAQVTRVRSVGLGSQLSAGIDRLRERTGSPVAEASDVTSGFGWRRDPISGDATFHRGIDIKAAYGDDVPVVAAGRVVSAGDDGGYGTAVVVEHANGTRTRYAHLSVALVRPGEDVPAGRVIGRAGSSGRATGPHVHFELLDRNGVPMDPSRAGH